MWVFACALAFAKGAASQVPPRAETYESPRLRSLSAEMANRSADATREFWAQVQGLTPLIETESGNSGHVLVTFLWRGDDTTHSVQLYGGLPAARYYPWSKTMTRMAATDVWFRTERIPTDARFQYAFSLNAPEVDFLSEADLVAFGNRYPRRADPRNPRLFDGQSYVELSNAPSQPYVDLHPNVVPGTLRRDSLRSAVLNEVRRITIHRPSQAVAGSYRYPLLIQFDGEWWTQSGHALPTIVDNLVAQREIPPLITVLVDNQGVRDRDLPNSPAFADFLATELIPWLRRTNTELTPDARKVIVSGASNGGLAAAYAALRHSSTFGNVLAQAGWWAHAENNYATNYFTAPTYRTEPGWIMRAFAASPRLPIRFYLDVGCFDVYYADNLRMNRHMRDVLAAKGYPLVFREYNGGHDGISFRGTIADGLIALTGQWPRQ